MLYAPGMQRIDDIRSLVASVDRPVNVLALPGTPSVAELAAIGVRRVSVGSGFARVALGATIDAARRVPRLRNLRLLERGRVGRAVTRRVP